LTRVVRARPISGHSSEVLAAGWRVAASAPGALAGPGALDAAALDWVPATVPATAASALRAAGRFSLDGPPRRFDAEDWWWRARFPASAAGPGAETWLCFDGLATLADVWLNGSALFSSDDMWLAHERRVDDLLAGDNELVLRFRALDAALGARRPRPRWRAPMIENQQLRWFRATLLGRTPGWSPPAAAVGPFRPIRLERRAGVAIDEVRLDARLEGGDGVVEIACRARAVGGGEVEAIELAVARGDAVHRAALAPDAEPGSFARPHPNPSPGRGSDRRSEAEAEAEASPTTRSFHGRLEIARPERWWPHTHGDPALYQARLHLAGHEVDLGAIGFRELALATSGGDFTLSVNGAEVFCRGACFTPLDPVSLHASPAAYAAAVGQARAAGMNMLRLSGAMIYEDDAFFDACDAQGVLVWQDFMFANMDYPEDDAGFAATVAEEARQVLARLRARPSPAMLCGNSEVEQQAAMWGAPRERWSPRLFHEVLPALARELCPGVPYVPSSACGGAFPHQASEGPTSYYGVGAYLRPLEDARRSEVRFASECLAFANVPEPEGLAAMPGGLSARVHHPGWKARTPRDLGAGWDFDDVRDHYVAELFGVDPLRVRYADHDRYLALGRAAVGEVMAATFAEWRRARSRCRGGLIWFLRDLWPGAGWGVIDAAGAPKSAWFHLRRALAPVVVSLSDEGVNGVCAHVVNERPTPLAASLEVSLYRSGEVLSASGRLGLELGPREAIERPIASLFEGFLDTSYAYRFGPPAHDLVVAVLRGGAGTVLSEAFHFPLGRSSARERDVGLAAEARPVQPDIFAVTVRSRRFAASVFIEAEGFAADDNHFHLAPGGARVVTLRRAGGSGPLRGTVQALNAEAPAKIVVVNG
jgi:beta-mannosidase